ncbi:MAG: heavy metal-associated domain-containing protein [Eubacteriales bacterium]|nr:heavy metal-associated domain-containing protein [Eubacteriales bacterium]
MRKITLKVDGMQCGMCESHMNELIRKNYKVKKVKSSHSTGECTIIAEKDIPRMELQHKLAEIGYKLLDMQSEEYKKKGLFW